MIGPVEPAGPRRETDRLVLRRWRAGDLAPFAAMNADPAVVEFLPGPLEPAASDALAGSFEADWERGVPAPWAIEVPGVAPFAGFVGLHAVTFDAPFADRLEVGWRLATAFWGRGYATEGARAALDYAFAERGEPEVVSFTFEGNHRSRRVMERLGMRPAGGFDHPRLPGHPLERHVLYRIDAAAWAAPGGGS